MAVSRAYPHTVTLWCKAGEDSERKAIWRRRVFDGVRWTDTRTKSGDTPQDEVQLLIPSVFSGYIDPLTVAAGHNLGGAQWTLANGTRVALGECLSPEPPPKSLAVKSCKTLRRGRGIDHFEATAQ